MGVNGLPLHSRYAQVLGPFGFYIGLSRSVPFKPLIAHLRIATDLAIPLLHKRTTISDRSAKDFLNQYEFYCDDAANMFEMS